MSFLHETEKLPEKLEQADLVNLGYKWGKRDGIINLAREIQVAISIHGNFIKAISAMIEPYIHEDKKKEGVTAPSHKR